MDLQQMIYRRIAWMPIVWRVRLVLTAGLVAANFGALVIVYLLISRVIPLPSVPNAAEVSQQNVLIGSGYVVVVGILGLILGFRDLEPLVRLLESEDEATDEERRRVLEAPLLLFVRQGLLWAVGALLFGVFNFLHDERLGLAIAAIVAMAGASVANVTYLTTERAFRPLAGRVLASGGGVPDRFGVRRVATRVLSSWVLGSGVAIAGLVAVGGAALVAPVPAMNRDSLAVTMVALGSVSLVVGAFTIALASIASSDPIRALREAVAEVQSGNLDARVRIYDGTEIGVLQAGFNDMVAGLQEREQIRELFGRHVGDDVARRALAGGVELGGEVRDIAVLFVDIVGSTTLAEDRPPEEVVGLLNRFFEVVIDVVHRYDGWINKFEGDAALAIWGAPVEVDDRDTLVLAAARVMGRRLRQEVPEIGAGIGVSAGRAVAGNVGAAERYEYTVIGDPVNEAARLTDVAKAVPGRVVANAKMLLTANGQEAHWWSRLDPVVVRGRTGATEIATPRLAD